MAALFFISVTAIGQNNRARLPQGSEDSILASPSFYIGIVAVIALVCLAFVMRRGRAGQQIEMPAGISADNLRLTYKGNNSKLRDEAILQKPVIVSKPKVKEGFAAFPIASFVRLQRSNAYLQLPDSTDPALLNAIEQTNEESDEDVTVRSQALKLISDYRTSNAVAAVAQMALYDLSSKLRSDAVLQLAEFDHESVFETIVTCCADPTREVRASAARALSKVTFDRAQAWTRIVESGDIARLRHAAWAAIEGDLVTRSFDRLIHSDRKVAYEAFALVTLLIRAGETEAIENALVAHKDENVKLAILHTVGCSRDGHSLDWLQRIVQSHEFTPNVEARIHELLLQPQPATV